MFYPGLIYTVKFWTRAPSRSNFLHFHAVFDQFWPLVPPLGNPGTATGNHVIPEPTEGQGRCPLPKDLFFLDFFFF